MKIYFTADLHLGHQRVLELCHRPFKTVQEMDDTLIENINRVVKVDDRIIIAGDVTFGNPINYIERIRCRNIDIVLGSHDYRWRSKWKSLQLANRVNVHEVLDFNTNGHRFYILHYPCLSWPSKKYGIIHLHGHLHGRITRPIHNSMDIGIDCNNYQVFSVPEIIARLQDRNPASESKEDFYDDPSTSKNGNDIAGGYSGPIFNNIHKEYGLQ